jgi:small subunit ribosomal protein S17e
MGRVRTNLVKRASRQIIEKYYWKLTMDFDTNKKIVEEVAQLPSRRIRNKIAGFTTHLMRRIQRGPVRGISLKLQEEERERRLDYVPDKSQIDVEKIEIGAATKEMLDAINFGDLGLTVTDEGDSTKVQKDSKFSKDRKPAVKA